MIGVEREQVLEITRPILFSVAFEGERGGVDQDPRVVGSLSQDRLQKRFGLIEVMGLGECADQSDAGFEMIGPAFQGLSEGSRGFFVAAAPQVDALSHREPRAEVVRDEAHRRLEHMQASIRLIGAEIDCREDLGGHRVGPEPPCSFEHDPGRTDLLERGQGQATNRQGFGFLQCAFTDGRDRNDRKSGLARLKQVPSPRQCLSRLVVASSERMPRSRFPLIVRRQRKSKYGEPEADLHKSPASGPPADPTRHQRPGASILIGADNVAAILRAQRPDDLHRGARLDESHRSIAHGHIGTAGMEAAHIYHARGVEIAAV